VELYRKACLLLAEADIIFDDEVDGRVNLDSLRERWRVEYKELIKRMSEENMNVPVIMARTFGGFGDISPEKIG
jgi:hypothetical protein